MKKRAKGHTQLYWVEIGQGAALGASHGEILSFVGTCLCDFGGPVTERVVFVQEAGLGAMLSSGPFGQMAFFVETVLAVFVFGRVRDEIAVLVIVHRLAVAPELAEGG